MDHPYAGGGTYSATFWVNDSGGASLSETFTIDVAGAPAASLSASPTATDVGISDALTATVQGGTAPYSYALLTGDGTPVLTGSSSSTSMVFHHVYQTAGTYTLQLWVNDTLGGCAYTTAMYVVNAALASAATAHPSTGETGEIFDFNGTFTGGTATFTYAWQFGDGTGSTGSQDVTHAYATTATFTATFWVNDSAGGSSSATVTVTIVQGPVVTVSPTSTATDVGVAVTFGASATDGVAPYSFAWEFGDGTSGTSASTTHAYATAGTFTVMVWGNDSAHGSGHATLTVQVNPLPAISTFVVSPTSVTVDHPVSFTVTVAGGTGAISYAYTGLPSGCTSTNAPSLSCSPTASGTFVVTASATDTLGKAATATVTLHVTTAPATFLGLPADEGYGLLAAVVVLVIAVIVAIATHVRRRRPPVVMTPTSGASSPSGTSPPKT